MLKASDLRVGNWILIPSVTTADWEVSYIPIKVTGITETGINPYFFKGHYVQEMRNSANFENIRPIPLTIEIMLNIGFKQQLVNGVIDKGYLSLNGLVLKFIDGCIFFEDEYLVKDIYTVNQLQNLYHSLVGTDLQFTL